MVSARDDALADHHLQPAQFGEQLAVLAVDPAVAAEQIHLALQGVGDAHRPAVVPERRVVALRGLVVQDDEVADTLVFELGLRVVFGDVGGVETGMREEAHHPRDRSLDQVDAGRLERFEKTAGQSDGHAVAVPELLAPAGLEPDVARFGQRGAVQIGHQDRGGLVLRHEGAGVDMAVAGAVLQRDPPLPACTVRCRPRHRQQRSDRFTRHRDRAIAGQPVLPVLVAAVQRLLDQQPAYARAVDEEVARHALAAFHHHGVDRTVVLSLQHLDDLAFGADDAALLGIAAQKARVQAGVEVESAGDVTQRRARHVGARTHELGLQRRGGVDRICTQVPGQPLLDQTQPVVVEGQRIELLADFAETVDIAVADATPVDEFDAQLEAALGGADELVLVDLERRVEVLDVRDRGFAHTDDADLVGLDQFDSVAWPQQFGQRRGGHPAGGAATDDDDVAYQ